MRLVFALAALAMTASPAFAAAPCKNAAGKFIKCPPPAAAKPMPAAAAAKPAAMTTSGPCKDAKGKFIKCAPAAMPAAATAAPKPAAPAAAAKPAKTATAAAKATKAPAQRCRNAKGQFAKCGTPGAK
jgi:hypothetical protein